MRRRFLPLAAAFSMMAAAAEDQSSGPARDTAGPHPSGERHTPDGGDALAVVRPAAPESVRDGENAVA